MSWDAVVVTCPKQSWVSSIREEVAIALNQVMMRRKWKMGNKLNVIMMMKMMMMMMMMLRRGRRRLEL